MRAFARAAVFFLPLLFPLSPGSAAAPVEITRALDMLKLGTEEAARSHPVTLRGVVTWSDAASKLAAVEDDSGGVFVELPSDDLVLKPGAFVDVAGVSGPGYYVPHVRKAAITVRGEAALPKARPLSAGELLTGQWCGHWVELHGVVCAVVIGRSELVLEVSDPADKLIRATLPPDAIPEAERLVGARIRLRGVPRAQLNQKSQLIGVRLLTPRAEDVVVVEPSPADPFAVAITSIGALGRYAADGASGRRVHVRGIVTYQRSGHTLFVQDATGDVLVQSRQNLAVRPGDVVDVVGFKDVVRRRLVLNNASFRKLANGPPPEPAAVEVREAWTGRHDSQLVRLRARLVDQLENAAEQRLTLQSGAHVFNADLPEEFAGARLDLRAGSELEVTGIWLQQSDISDTQQSYRLLLRSPADVTVLAAPPWWTLPRLVAVAGVLAAGVAFAGMWVVQLRRRVAEQTGRIARQMQAQCATETRCRELVENARDFVFTVDARGRFTSVNPAGERLTGYSATEAFQMSFAELLAPESRDILRALKAASQNPSCLLPQEVVIRAKDGRHIALEISAQLLHENGSFSGAECIARDLTDRKRVENELRTSQQRLGLLIQESPLGVIVWDDQFRAREWNRSAERIFGFTEREMLGRTADPIVPPAVREHVGEVWRRLISRQGGFHSTNENCTQDGRTIICSWYNAPLVDADDRVTGVASLVEDITDRIQSEEKLQVSESLYRNLVETSSDLIWSVNARGELTFANERALKATYGYLPAEVIGRNFSEFVLPELAPRTAEVFQRLRNGEVVIQFETTAVRRDGQPVHVSFNAIPVRDDAGRIIGATGTATDITRRFELEAQLRHAQKMDAVGQLAAGVAHDFNNLLTVIQGRAGLLMLKSAKNDDTTESLKEIAAAAERGARLIRQLLTFSRKNVLAPHALDLNEVVQQVSRMLQRLLGEDIALEFNLSRSSAHVFADGGMLEQVLVNLCVNARDAMPRGGRVVIGSLLVNLETTNPHANPERRAGKFVCLTVTDTGCGMDSETLSHIFEPFFTTKEVGKGTGLGLSMVYGIVKQHHGWVEVESSVRQGTSFRIYLPYQAKPMESVAETAPSTPVPRGHETILIVEDEPAVRRLVCGVLQDYGYRILSAANGQAALKLWREHAHEVDLLLTDMVMPEGVSGGELADRLTADKPGLRVICCSGYSAEIVSRRFKTRDDVVFMEKPYNPADLARKVRECLDRVRV
ncbi:MAG: PAS domain S-box protein [Verrucomicrobia bacterium]|nr:PAS domain S-box protein [Verrucomicrobiota bacterium]